MVRLGIRRFLEESLLYVRHEIITGTRLMTDTIQRSIAVDPDAVRSSNNSDDGETAAIIMQLRQKLKAQTEEVTALQSKLGSVHAEYQKEVS